MRSIMLHNSDFTKGQHILSHEIKGSKDITWNFKGKEFLSSPTKKTVYLILWCRFHVGYTYTVTHLFVRAWPNAILK